MKRQSGFTLIELIVVIVILGILAVTAAPRFLDIQSDAKKSALKGLKGAISSAKEIVYAKAVIKNVLAAKGTTTKLDDIKLHLGYPTMDHDGLGNAVLGLNSDWEVVTPDVTPTLEVLLRSWNAFSFKDIDPNGKGWKIDPSDLKDKSKSKGCFVVYVEALELAENLPPEVYLVDNDCG